MFTYNTLDDFDVPIDEHFSDFPESKKTSTYRTDKHLSSAIVRSECDFMEAHWNSPFIHYRSLRSQAAFYQEHCHTIKKFDERHLGMQCLIRQMTDLSKMQLRLGSTIKNRWRKFLSVSWRVFVVQKLSVFSQSSAERHLKSALHNLEHQYMRLFFDSDLQEFYFAYHTARSMIEHLSDSGETSEYTVGDILFHARGNTVFFTCNGEWHHEPWEAVIGAGDVLQGRFTTLFYCKLLDLFKLRHRPMVPLLHKFIRATDSILRRHGNDAFTAIKAVGSIAIGLYLLRIEHQVPCSFLDETLRGICEKLPDFQNDDYYLFFDQLIQCPEDFRVAMEYVGLSKVGGFPTIDVVETLETLHRYGEKVPSIDSNLKDEVLYTFRYLICKSHYEKFRRWPEVVVLQEAPAYLHYSVEHQRWDERQIQYADFKHIIFKKNFSLPENVEILNILSDKAISCGLKTWSSLYNANAYKVFYGKSRPPVSTKTTTGRLILDFLSTDEYKLSDVLNKIETGTVPKEWKVIELVPKERELKVAARCFCKLTLPMRLWQSATESALANDIYTFIRYQSMTMSEAELSMRLESMAHALNKLEHPEYMVLVVDFEKWNQNHVHENSSCFMRELDDLYGCSKVFSYTHIFPTESWILYKDSFIPPQVDDDGLPIPCSSAWFGNRCFFEGMRQKGWTLITISLITYVALKSNVMINILGQGDNQVVVIRIPPRNHPIMRGKTADQYVEEFKTLLVETATRFGIPIKALESWSSKTLLEYSKKYFQAGVELESPLKSVFRSGSMVTSPLQTFEMSISTIISSGVAIAAKDKSADPSFLLTVFNILDELGRVRPVDFEQADESGLCALLLTTQSLGLLPAPKYLDFMIRGTPDPLSDSLYLWQYANQFRDIGSFLTNHIPRTGRRDFLLLIEDPLGLPLDLPVRGTNIVKRMIEGELTESYVKNGLVKTAFRNLHSDQRMKLIEDFMSICPCNPRLLNVFYSVTALREAYEIIGRFSHSTSLNFLLTPSKMFQMKDNVRIAEQNFVNMIFSRCQHPGPYYSNILEQLPGVSSECTCPTEAASLMRNYMWGVDVVGTTMPSFLHQTRIDRIDNIPFQFRERTILFTVAAPEPGKSRFNTRGPYLPYSGSYTEVKIKKGVVYIDTSIANLRAVQKLLLTLRWCDSLENTNLKALVSVLMSERVDLELDQIENLIQNSYRGCITHRLRDLRTSGGALSNSTSSFRTYVKFSTDMASLFARGATNYSIMFQELFIGGTSHLQQLELAGLDVTGDWGLVVGCKYCTTEVHDDKFTLPRPPQYISKVRSTQYQELIPNLPAVIKGLKTTTSYNSLVYLTAVDIVRNRLQADPLYKHSLLMQNRLHERQATSTLKELSKIKLCDLLDCLYVLYGHSDPFITVSSSKMIHSSAQHNATSYLELDPLAQSIIISRRVPELRAMINLRIPARHYHSISNTGIKYLMLVYMMEIHHHRGLNELVRWNLIDYRPTLANVWAHVYRSSIRVKHPGVTPRLQQYVKQEYMKISSVANETYDTFKLNPPFVLTTEEEAAIPLIVPSEIQNPSKVYSEIDEFTDQLRDYDPQKLAILDPVHPSLQIPCTCVTLDCNNLDTETISDDRIPVIEAVMPELPQLGHIARSLMSTSTSCSKLYEILSLVQEEVDFQSSGVALTLAEGSGSMASLILHMFPNLCLIYNDLLPVDNFMDAHGSFLPPAIALDPCQIQDRVLFPEVTTTGVRDLCNLDTIKKIIRCVDAIRDSPLGRVALITCDAELANEPIQYERLLWNLEYLWRAVGNCETLFVCKLYLFSTTVIQWISHMSQYCMKMRFIKPNSSTRSSGELYIAFSNFKECSGPVSKTIRSAVYKSVLEFDSRRKDLRSESLKSHLSRQIATWHAAHSAVGQHCLSSLGQDAASLGIENCYGKEITVELLKSKTALIDQIRSLSYENISKLRSAAFQASVRRQKRHVYAGNILNQLAAIQICLDLLKHTPTYAIQYYRDHVENDLRVVSCQPTIEHFREKKYVKWNFNYNVPFSESEEFDYKCFSDSYRELLPTVWKVYSRIVSATQTNRSVITTVTRHGMPFLAP